MFLILGDMIYSTINLLIAGLDISLWTNSTSMSDRLDPCHLNVIPM